MSEGLSYEIVPLAEEHLDQLMAIENASFAVPWRREEYLYDIKMNKLAHYVAVVAGDKLLGYGGMWLIFNEGHINNIAIHPEMRGKRIGEAVLAALSELCCSLGGDRLTLEVRESNLSALRLYERMGFVAAGIRPNYYSDNGEAAIIMWLQLTGVKK